MTMTERTRQADRQQVRKLIGGLRATPKHGEVAKAVGAIALLVVCFLIGAAAWQLAFGALLLR